MPASDEPEVTGDLKNDPAPTPKPAPEPKPALAPKPAPKDDPAPAPAPDPAPAKGFLARFLERWRSEYGYED